MGTGLHLVLGLLHVEPSLLGDLVCFVTEHAKKIPPPLQVVGTRKRLWDQAFSHTGLMIFSCKENEIRVALSDGVPVKLCPPSWTPKKLKTLFGKLKTRHSDTICTINSDKTGRIEGEMALSSFFDDIWSIGQVKSDLWCEVRPTLGSTSTQD